MTATTQRLPRVEIARVGEDWRPLSTAPQETQAAIAAAVLADQLDGEEDGAPCAGETWYFRTRPWRVAVCGNAETAADGFALELWRDEAVRDAAGDAVFLLEREWGSLTTVEIEAGFREWHGGHCHGLGRYVALLDAEAPAWLHEIAERAADAMHATLLEWERREAADLEDGDDAETAQ